MIYDSEALVEPVRILWHRTTNRDGTRPSASGGWNAQPRYPVNGYATQVAPGQVIEYRVPDMFDRPWSKIWQEYFEKNMERPVETLDLGFK